MVAGNTQNGPATTVRDESASAASERLGHRPIGPVIFWLAIATALVHLYFNTISTLSELWSSALHFGLFGLICTLTTPMLKARSIGGQRIVLGVDVVLGLTALACAFYLIIFEDDLYQRGFNFDTGDWVVSIVSVVLVLELARRTVGWFIPVLCVVALTYVAWWGQYVGGLFNFPGLSWETVLYRSYIGGQGMLGSIARISWTYVFMFILFGAFLVKSGAGDFIIELARCAAGRFVGGPGFVAVFASGLMGSVSGSSVANTVSTGVITIPLMRKAGFPARFAAGVEAAASTGGQLMPPVIGAGAFIMASYTQVSYLTIIGVAALMYGYTKHNDHGDSADYSWPNCDGGIHHRYWQYILTDDYRLGRWKPAHHDSTGRSGLPNSGDGVARNSGLYRACNAFRACDLQSDRSEPVGGANGEWQLARAGQGHFHASRARQAVVT